MTARLRIVPPAWDALAADPDAPAIVFASPPVSGRDAFALATGRIGVGIDLSAPTLRIIASPQQLRRLAMALREFGERGFAQALDDYLNPVPAWRLRTRELPLDRPQLMGIVNLTEDSFSGDGVGLDLAAALRRADTMRAEGASIIDVGAESARADRPIMDEQEESALAARVVAALVREDHCVSIDTYKGAVARAAIAAGADVVNDISGLTQGTSAAEEAHRGGAGYVLNYSYSVPKRRPAAPPVYADVVAETIAWMEERLAQLQVLGLSRERVAIDPGIAFGKSHDEDIAILRRLGELQRFGVPVLLAHSRKNFIGSINGRPPAERDLETHVVSALAYAQGVRVFRVHDVAGTRRALDIAQAMVSAKPGAFAPDDVSWPWRAGSSGTHMTRGEADKPAPEGQRW